VGQPPGEWQGRIIERPPAGHGPMYKLVLIRHGESTWNLENRFTGWTDVPLTDTGVAQARRPAGC
jgi:hypothetical protein